MADKVDQFGFLQRRSATAEDRLARRRHVQEVAPALERQRKVQRLLTHTRTLQVTCPKGHLSEM